jgi:hypothetical protein
MRNISTYLPLRLEKQSKRVSADVDAVLDSILDALGNAAMRTCFPQLAKNKYPQFWEDYMDKL